MAEERVQRRLAAILAADVVGYSRLMGKDEIGTLARLKTLRRDLFDPMTKEYGGRIFKTTGDGALVEFKSAVDAVSSAIDIQRALAKRNEDVPEHERITLRIGISLGDVIVEGSDLYGNGVNVAARMEGLAEPGGICVSGNVHEHMRTTTEVGFEDLGEQAVKNIERPVRCYRVDLETGNAAGPRLPQPNAPTSISDKPSIAVLPFDNLSGDPEQEYFSDGISEDIITALSRIRQFFVIARNTTFTYKGQAVDVQAVANDLGAQYVLEGSVRKAGNRARITAQLIDGSTGNHLWAERYDRDLEDIFAVQDDITQTVVGAIEPELGKAELQRGISKNPESLNAWDLYHRGVARLHMYTEDSLKDAVHYFKQVVDEDPGFAAAYARCAECIYCNIVFGFSNDLAEDRAEVLQWSKKAVQLDGDDPQAHLSLGMAQVLNGEHAVATEVLRRAIDLNPSSPMAHSIMGLALTGLGRTEDAIQHHMTAIQIGARNPALPTFMGRLGHCYEVLGDFEKAADWLRRATQFSNTAWVLFAQLAHSCVRLGRMDEARQAVDRLLEHNPRMTVTYARELMSTWSLDQKPKFAADLIAAGLPE